ncbi:hypothetical protein PO909_029959 [Leuciscus waleckii]
MAVTWFIRENSLSILSLLSCALLASALVLVLVLVVLVLVVLVVLLVLAPPHRGHPLLNWAMRTNQGRVSAVGFPLTPSPVPGHLQS